ncbi:hypothetical protein B0I35DRAFT_440937 [Stachybotrys elegans]|uniref:Uncharacterized protein n=1 Tax=Stachybotrys elegans TaxID=80388 RepID=A0A8K0SLG4_9HYPO|nr:hypothetical protein B0I35DRAFT_440937 [Stachybotrys elegans]
MGTNRNVNRGDLGSALCFRSFSSSSEGGKKFSGFQWNYFSSLPEGPLRSRAEGFLASVNWNALKEYAADKRNGINCSLRPDIGLGGNHMVRIIEFTDGIQWAARLRLPALAESSSLSNLKTRDCEFHTISLLRHGIQGPIDGNDVIIAVRVRD